MNINFDHAYLDTEWFMRTVEYAVLDVSLMEFIPVHGMIEELQIFYLERRNRLVEMLFMDFNWRMNQLSYG